MKTLPQIFDSKANFVEPASLDGLDAPTLARLDGVRTAAATLRTAQDAERDAIQEVTDCLHASQDARDYRLKHFPPSTPHDEWVRNFGNSEQRRALAQREAGHG
jgi:hypothetical protein